MNRFPHAFLARCLPLVLVATLLGCDGSNSGGTNTNPVDLFFGTNNIRECMPITVDVDLATADAELEFQNDGSVDCALDASLAVAGCTGIFEIVDAGATLRVVIDGCEVPSISNLFECGFEDADTSAVASSTSAFCDCVGEPLCDWNIYCDRTPGICVGADADPSGCEDCFNGEDDDNNGYVDCDDQNCHIEDCGWGQTTITCSTTSTSTTVSVTTTTLASSGGAGATNLDGWGQEAEARAKLGPLPEPPVFSAFAIWQ